VSRRVFVRVAILLLVVAGSYLVGAITVLGRFPGRHAVTAVYEALRVGRHGGTPPAVSTLLSTTLVDVRREARTVVGATKDRTVSGLEGTGGGLTSFGEDVLVLPFSGLIHAATHANAVRPTGIVGPETHRAALAAVADSLEALGFPIEPGLVRYNDLTFVAEGPSRGLLVVYTEYHAGPRCFTNTLARLPIAHGVRSIDEVTATPGDWIVVHRTTPCLPLRARKVSNPGNGSGGRVVVVPPATAYWTTGDFSYDGMQVKGEVLAQDPAAEYGKVLATDLVTGATRTVSLGHRNPQGILARADGAILITEHGPHGGDELNTIQEGANYGWPLVSYGRPYSGLSLRDAVPRGRHEGFALPSFVWVPSVGISSLTRIEGFHPAWDGDLLVASLNGKTLYRLRFEGDRVMYAEPIPIGSRIRDVHQHGDGRLVLWTDYGQLVFLTAAAEQGDQVFLRRFLKELPADLQDPTARAIEACATCHDLTTGQPGAAPSLARVYGGRWTREALLRFLESPERFAPGTTMPNPGITDPRVREAIVSLLERLDRAY
jgi:aldose sugar dehydrogenase